MFNKKFGTSACGRSIGRACRLRGWSNGKPKRSYSGEEIDFLRRNVTGVDYATLADMFNARFGTSISAGRVGDLCRRKGFANGLDCRYKAGHTEGVGRKMPNSLPDGSEYVNAAGYIMQKHNGAWQFKHILAIGLESAIVNGDGVNKPIGMTRDLTDANYPMKTATVITDFQPVTLGTHIMAPLTRGGKRNVSNVILVVNPLDYWQIVYGATTILPLDGQYRHGVLPIPARFEQSEAMPQGRMAAGMARDYFLGAGFNTGIITSDEYKFVDRQRIYLTELAANGRPLDKDSFLLFDISGVLPQLNTTVNINNITAETGGGASAAGASGFSAMTNPQLIDYAKESGIDLAGAKSKAEMIAAIEAAEAAMGAEQ
jgi:hypothetical protein